MKGRAVEELVYECMFPKPKAVDPQNFHGLLQRSLVPEVRLETAAFYGSLDSQEAQYPGLDYSYPPHRVRLSRFTWHRRLFRAFDALKLTPHEIATLTKWEGTKWAKERFEKEQGVKIRDTTGDCIEDWVPPELRETSSNTPTETKDDEDDDVEEEDDELEDGEAEEWDDGDDSDIDIGESIGLDLNERLRAAVARREAGDASGPIDEEWEQWLKEAAENGTMTFAADRALAMASYSITPGSTTASAMTQRAIPQQYMIAAREGQWGSIPENLHDRVRQIQHLVAEQTVPTPLARVSDSISVPSTTASPEARTSAATLYRTNRMRPIAGLRSAVSSISNIPGTLIESPTPSLRQ